MEYLDFLPNLIVEIVTKMTIGRLVVVFAIFYTIDYFLKKYFVVYRSKTHALRVFIAFLVLLTYGLHIVIYYLSYPRADMIINELFAGSLQQVYIGGITMQQIAVNILLLIITIGCRYTAVLVLAKFSQQEKDNQEAFAEEKWYDKRGLFVRGVVIVCGLFFYGGSFYLSVPGAAQRRVENVRQKTILNPSDSTEYRTLTKQMASIEKQEEVIRKRQEQSILALQNAQKEVDNASNPATKKVAQYLLRLKQEQSPNEEKAIASSFALVSKQKNDFQARYDKEMNRLRDLYDQRAGERNVLEQEEAKEGKQTARFFEVILMLLIVFIVILKGKVNHIVLADYQSVIVEEVRPNVVRTTDRRESVSSAAKPKALGTGLKHDDKLSALNPKYTSILKELDSISFLDDVESKYWKTPKFICELVEYEYNVVTGGNQDKSMNRIIEDAGYASTTGKRMFYKKIQGKVTPKTQRLESNEGSETKSKIKITKEEDSDFDSKDKNITLQDKLKDSYASASENIKKATRSASNSFYEKLKTISKRKTTKVESNETESEPTEQSELA